MWESSQLLGKNIAWSTDSKELQERIDRCTGCRDTCVYNYIESSIENM